MPLRWVTVLLFGCIVHPGCARDSKSSSATTVPQMVTAPTAAGDDATSPVTVDDPCGRDAATVARNFVLAVEHGDSIAWKRCLSSESPPVGDIPSAVAGADPATMEISTNAEPNSGPDFVIFQFPAPTDYGTTEAVGTVVYHDPPHVTDINMTVRNEGGAWRVSAIVGYFST